MIGWLFSHPDQRYYVRQLTALVDEDSTNVSRELARLEGAGILISTLEGKQKYYQANRQSPLYDELHGMAVKTAGVADVLRSALEPLRNRIQVAFVFGSVAAGDEGKQSDIDVMVVGEATFDEVSASMSGVEKATRRETNPVIFTPSEFRKRLKTSDHFVKTVFEGKKIFLIGDEGELRRLAE